MRSKQYVTSNCWFTLICYISCLKRLTHNNGYRQERKKSLCRFTHRRRQVRQWRESRTIGDGTREKFTFNWDWCPELQEKCCHYLLHKLLNRAIFSSCLSVLSHGFINHDVSFSTIVTNTTVLGVAHNYHRQMFEHTCYRSLSCIQSYRRHYQQSRCRHLYQLLLTIGCNRWINFRQFSHSEYITDRSSKVTFHPTQLPATSNHVTDDCVTRPTTQRRWLL